MSNVFPKDQQLVQLFGYMDRMFIDGKNENSFHESNMLPLSCQTCSNFDLVEIVHHELKFHVK